MLTLPALPYALNALEPFISERTMDFHYHKHHQTYIDNLNKLISNTPFAKMELEKIITETAEQKQYGAIFNNAAQVWNHTFFWHSMKPRGSQLKNPALYERITSDFGSFEQFKTTFKQEALAQFGSGWVWLIENQRGKLEIVKTSNADTPLAHHLLPLLTCDVWEHAYYLDYQNRRGEFIDGFLNHLSIL